jgi:hypothetical protein
MPPLDLIRQKCIEANPDIEKAQEVPCYCHNDPKCINAPKRPIRLADVLLAIGQKYGDHVLEFSGVETCSLEAARSVRKWNLREDDLTKQSPETLEFLASLLKDR